MASSGDPVTLTFTPPVAGDLIVTCTFEAQRSTGSDWGTGAQAYLFMNQGAGAYTGDIQKLSTTRLKYTLRYVFSVSAGVSVTCGLHAGVTGANTMSLWNMELEAEHVKR